MNYTQIFAAVVTGELDGDLPRLATAIHERRKLISRREAAQVMLQLQPGDRVRFRNSVRPAYLAGVEAVILALKTKKVSVKLDHPTGRFKGIITTPASLIEKV
jgi:hypothetical protein